MNKMRAVSLYPLSPAKRAGDTLVMLSDRRNRGGGQLVFNAVTVGQLVEATSIPHVASLYEGWQRGEITEDYYHSAVLGALARVRVEQGE